MAIINSIDITNIKTVDDLVRFLGPFIKQAISALNKNLNYQDNIRSSVVNVAFPSTANSNLAVAHNLATTPIGYIPIAFSAAANIYNGSSLVFGPTFANLKCDTAGITATILFI